MAALTPAERDRIRQLHGQGLSRNAIATEIGRGVATVSRVAKDLGLSFDRSATQAATQAKVADAKARRAQLMQDLLHDAHKLRSQMWQQCEYIDHGGKDFVEARWWQPEPTPADKLKLMQAARAALDGSLRLDAHDGDGSIEQVGSLLGSLFDTLRDRHPESAAADDDG
jgi:hypothetical protein